MNDLIVVPQTAHWQRLKRLVLDSVSSPITRRVYNLGRDEFFEWYGREPRPGFTKATVAAWRVALEARGLGAVSINVRITAVRKLAVEAADNGLLAPELASGITRVPSFAGRRQAGPGRGTERGLGAAAAGAGRGMVGIIRHAQLVVVDGAVARNRNGGRSIRGGRLHPFRPG